VTARDPRRVRASVPLLVALILIVTREAYAYIDPGTGSIIIQVLIGTMLALSFTLRRFWSTLGRFFYNLFSHAKGQQQDHK